MEAAAPTRMISFHFAGAGTAALDAAETPLALLPQTKAAAD
jgi:hypothetical protein